MEDNNKKKPKWYDNLINKTILYVQFLHFKYKEETNIKKKIFNLIHLLSIIFAIFFSISLWGFILSVNYDLYRYDNLNLLEHIELFFVYSFYLFIGTILINPLTLVGIYILDKRKSEEVSFKKVSNRYILFHVISSLIITYILFLFALTPLRYDIYKYLERDRFYLSQRPIPEANYIQTTYNVWVKDLF